ncbi:MAG: endonuclease MutS2 [Gemmatimonadota bacterium]
MMEEAPSGLEAALRALEFGRVLERIASEATSGPGRERVLAMRPLPDREAAESALRDAGEMIALLEETDWTPAPLPDGRAALARLEPEGAVLEPAELLALAGLLVAARRTREELGGAPAERPRLAARVAHLLNEPALEARLERAIDPAGKLKDGASPDLRRTRSALRRARGALVDRLEEFARALAPRHRVEDGSVTLRGGRYCVPVRREGLSAVGGIVHGESGTRQTVFVEPPCAVEAMNEIVSLEAEEERAVGRILRDLSDALRPLRPRLLESRAILAELDACRAIARVAIRHGGERPRFTGPAANGSRIRLRRAFHPLLLAGPGEAVPFDLELGAGETVLLVSGPNAGGKTVLLKAIGLLSALARSGIVPPLGPGSEMPFFRSMFAVIGDEQSLDASLSTFGARIRSLRRILEEADDGSLVLLDELGASTDPAEGAALAGAVIETLAGRTGLTVATTHLGALKALAAKDGRVVNASLEFDRSELRPTYRFRRDRPGRSYALEIARRMGLPEEILTAAAGRLTRADRELERLLGELEDRQAELESLLTRARAREAAVAARERDLEGRSREVSDRERALDREASRRVEQRLRVARREVEDVIAELRARAAVDPEAAAGEGGEARPDAPRRARAAIEGMIRRERQRAAAALSRDVDAAAFPAGGPRVGDRVRSRRLGVRGRVVEVRDREVRLEAAGLRLSVDAGDLEPCHPSEAEGPEGRPAPAAEGSGRPELVARPEVDLRGLRVDEVRGPLLASLDAAIAADLPRLRIIHGKGTGAVRSRVREILSRDARVDGFRSGAFDEGGSGVTVVEFRDAFEERGPS